MIAHWDSPEVCRGVRHCFPRVCNFVQLGGCCGDGRHNSSEAPTAASFPFPQICLAAGPYHGGEAASDLKFWNEHLEVAFLAIES